MVDYGFKKVGTKYMVYVRPEGKIMASLQDLCEKENIKFASITGIGSVNKATFGFPDPKTMVRIEKTFEGQYEIVSLVGDVCTFNDKPILHLHLAISGQDFNVVGGHFVEGTIYSTSEIIIDVADGVIEKKANPLLNGMPTLDL